MHKVNGQLTVTKPFNSVQNLTLNTTKNIYHTHV